MWFFVCFRYTITNRKSSSGVILIIMFSKDFPQNFFLRRVRKSKKDKQHNGQRKKGQTTLWQKEKRTKEQTTIVLMYDFDR